jgi:hypothetical protein
VAAAWAATKAGAEPVVPDWFPTTLTVGFDLRLAEEEEGRAEAEPLKSCWEWMVWVEPWNPFPDPLPLLLPPVPGFFRSVACFRTW